MSTNFESSQFPIIVSRQISKRMKNTYGDGQRIPEIDVKFCATVLLRRGEVSSQALSICVTENTLIGNSEIVLCL